MHLIFFSAAGWEGWDLDRRPLIRQAMPVLVDDDLRFEDERGLRASVIVNQWLRELPVSGALMNHRPSKPRLAQFFALLEDSSGSNHVHHAPCARCSELAVFVVPDTATALLY